MFFSSYRKKLIIIFILIAVIPITSIGLIMNFKVKKQTINEEIYLKTELVKGICDKVDIWIEDKEEVIKTIAFNYPLIRSMIVSEHNVEINNYLKTFILNSQSIKNLYIALENGKKFNLPSKTTIENIKESDWYKNAYVNRKITWLRPSEDILGHNVVVTVSAPLYEENGEFAGVLGADITLDDIVNKVKDIEISKNDTLYVIDSSGSVVTYIGDNIFNPSDKGESKYKKEINDFTELVVSNNTGNLQLKLDKEYFAVFSQIPSLDWRIVSITEKKDFFNSIANIYYYIIISLVGTFILVIIFAIRLSKSFSRPLEELKEGAIQIQQGNYDYKITSHNRDEFGQVVEVFNNMTLQIKETHKKLEGQTQQLLESNRQLQEINIELEASYEQLQATTSQLNDSEEKYRTLIENMFDLVWIVDINGNIIFINNQIELMLKYKKSEIMGKNIFDLIDIWEIVSDDADILEKVKEKDYRNIEVIFNSGDGKKYIIELNTKRIYENRTLVGIQCVGRDITDRKKMEQQILQKNIELSTINNISKSLNSTFNLQMLLNNVVESIVDLMDISICTIRLLDGNNILKLAARAGILKESTISEIIYVKEKIFDNVIKNSEMDRLYEFLDESIIESTQRIMLIKGVKFASIIPIKVRNKILGVFIIATKEKLREGDFNILVSVSNQTAMVLENIKLYQDLKKNYMKTIETLAAAVEAKDKYTEGHSLRVSKYGYMISQHMNLPKETCEDIKIAGILHDIGKIGISDTILAKPGRLTEDEYKAIIQHPVIGSRILESVGFPDVIMDAIKYHHKRYDLKGYPKDVDLDKLPLSASIIGVADAFDAMTSTRSYRKSMTTEEAVNELIRNKGRQFDPAIVDVFVDIYNNGPWKIEEILNEK